MCIQELAEHVCYSNSEHCVCPVHQHCYTKGPSRHPAPSCQGCHILEALSRHHLSAHLLKPRQIAHSGCLGGSIATWPARAPPGGLGSPHVPLPRSFPSLCRLALCSPCPLCLAVAHSACLSPNVTHSAEPHCPLLLLTPASPSPPTGLQPLPQPPHAEGSYLAHTQGKRHQQNLAKRAALEAKDKPVAPAPMRRVTARKTIKIGRPGYQARAPPHRMGPRPVC